MKNTEKITASEMRTLWGSRVVIWITMILVLGYYRMMVR